ncbi:MAG TPA: hypothetical protein PLO23_03780 [Alphaproteobacteria bacterium]|nr:hypothetical protein [Alphaproteobacteria bacterium]
MRSKLFLIGAALLTCGLAACGSGPAEPDTTGQQLLDLQDAYKNRAITPDEYEDQKEEILDRAD